jgi:hypothetical protein
MIFKTFFSPGNPMKYASRMPYEFNAGGKGFDLFRMKVFSERYNFKIQLTSKRCCFILRDNEECPGSIDECVHCANSADYQKDRGTTVSVQFHPAHRLAKKEALASA